LLCKAFIYRIHDVWLVIFLGKNKNRLGLAKAIEVDFYAFLSVTDKRHATVLTGILRLTNENRKRRAIGEICEIIAFITNQKVLQLDGVHLVKFNPKTQINFHCNFLPFHPNGICFKITLNDGKVVLKLTLINSKVVL
jgi:L-serine dehydratase